MDNNQFKWQERFNIGVDIIDKEHKKLFNIMNKLITYSKDKEKSQWVCQEGIKYFKEHAMKHFAEEEVYMASISYQGFEMHRRLHDNFRKKTLPEMERELEATNYSEDAVEHFLAVCAGWLIGHTLTEDQAMTGKSLSKWIGLLPEEEQAAMKQVILQLLYELFRLDARVISDSYGGEKFGKGIYYHLVYGSEKGEAWEVFLIFEERLLLNTVGGVMGVEMDKLNTMTMNITRYIARQFLERIREHFPTTEVFEVKEEHLLTYDQFYKVYRRQTPQSSLLFDTGEGYFAFCVMAPHLLRAMEGTSIRPENAMTEIKKYLKHNEASEKGQKKNKILVVDDSAVVLQSMKEMLGKDYDIMTANSGVSALRSMFLERPDLVLLDYEMPVCDGRQVLEMIRSEKEFADMPVIFLTGTVDKERVTKVIALKPAGYLLKTMEPEKIKENIDDFFQKKS